MRNCVDLPQMPAEAGALMQGTGPAAVSGFLGVPDALTGGCQPDGADGAVRPSAGGHGSTPVPGMRVLAWPAKAAHNPYNGLLYDGLRALGVDVVEFTPFRLVGRPGTIWHLHWVEAKWNRPRVGEAAFRAAAILAMLQFARLRGVRIVWTVHNLQAHERYHPRLERWFWRAFISRVDGYLALSAAGKALARERFPRLRTVPGFVVPHGHYRDAYPATLTREEARARLGVPAEARVVAFLGKIRPYKNVPHLIRTLRTLTDPSLRLLVAGQPNLPRLADDVRAAVGDDPRIRLWLEHVPDDEVQVYLGAADLVVLPYQEVLNSGSALLALSFDRPVLVPERGAMGELAARVGADWVRTFTGSLSPAALDDAVQWARAPRAAGCEGLRTLSWAQIARETLDSFECVVRGTSR